MSYGGFVIVLQRDLRLARRKPMEALLPLAFFVVASTLFPLGVGPETSTLRQIAPGILWVGALLAVMLSLGSLYASDYADGSLEQMLLSGHSLVTVAVAKGLAHWLLTGLPLVVVTPLLGLLFDLQTSSLQLLAFSLLLGTPVLSFLGGLGAALTLGLRNGVVLVFMVVLPLCIPVLIFGAGAVSALEAGISPAGHLYLLGALLLLTLAGVPFATAAALRISV
jgi:heme exporter protein B